MKVIKRICLDKISKINFYNILENFKILNLDDAEDGNLINTSDEEKVSESEEEANSIIAIWNFQKQNYYLQRGN